MAKIKDETRVVVTIGTGEDTVTKVLPEKAYEALVKEAKEKGEAEPQLVAIQTFRYSEAETLADVSLLSGTEAVAVDIWNRAAILKQQAAIRDIMTEDGFTAKEGVYDLTPTIAEVKERKAMSPVEKALKILSGLTEADRARLLAEFASASA